MHKHVT